jgi:hypothetical protein
VKTLIPPGGLPAQGASPAPVTSSAQGPGKTVDDALPPPGLAREVYNRDSLRLRPSQNEVFTANGARELSAVEFYRLVGRPDLAASSQARKGERGLLYTFSFLTFGAGVASGVYVMSTAQNMNSPSCYAQGAISYNKCVQSNSNTKLIGAGLIAGGFLVGGLLLTWAALTPDMVTSPQETAQIVDQYNRNLSKRLTSVLAEPRVEVTPMFGKDGGGIAARFTF